MKNCKFSIDKCFGDHMVLQRGMPVRITGYAKAGDTVTGDFRGNKASAAVDDSGKWELTFPPQPAGGPFNLVVADGEGAVQTLEDVLVGEVWICSGQSNMEYPVETQGPFWGLPDGDAVAADGDSGIRLFQMPRTIAPEAPRKQPCGGKWKIADNPKSIKEFSAVAWFFGKALRRRLGDTVPVGLIHSSWGGTDIRAWIPRSAYEKAGCTYELSLIEKVLSGDKDTANMVSEETKKQLDAIKTWLKDKFFATDPATTAEALRTWASPVLPPEDEDKWVKGPRGSQGILAVPGVGWFRKEFTVPASWAGKEVILRAQTMNDCDETFVDGVKIGETTIDTPSWWAVQRIYKFKLSSMPGEKHVLAVRIQNHYCSGMFSGWITLERAEDAADIIDLDDGDWQQRLEFRVDHKKAGSRPAAPAATFCDISSPQVPATLYNGMIEPFLPIALRGAIWYQGCHNASEPEAYRKLQDLLVASWREKFRNPDLVFIVTQLAAFKEQRPEMRLPEDWWKELTPEESCTDSSFSNIRAVQEAMIDKPGCGVACIIDSGDHSDIHPSRKRPVGERLANEAMRLAYGDAKAFPSPIAAGARKDGRSVRVELRRPAPLVAAGATPTNVPASAHLFSLASADGKFVWADAVLMPDGGIVVTSPEISEPIRVEYAWSNYPPEDCIVRDADDGLPLFPFRLDVK